MDPETNNNADFNVPRPPDMRHELETFQKELSKWGELLDLWIFNLKDPDVFKAAMPVSVLQITQPLPPAPGPVPEHGHRPRPPHGVASAVSVRVTPLASGAAMVSVDGRTEMKLTAALAALFQALCDDTGSQPDLCVGWKTVGDLQLSLAKSLGGAVTEQAVKQLVFRLRNELQHRGEDRNLVQNHRKLGYRFALRRGGGL
jgi:hypothetical protein